MKLRTLFQKAAWVLAGMPLLAQAASDRHPVYDAGANLPTASQAETTQGKAEVCECSHARVIVTQREFPADSKHSVQLCGWRGERTSAQLAIRCSRHAPQLSVSCPGVQQADGKSLPVQVSMVRYTAAHGMPVGDIIGNETSCDQAAEVLRPAWVQVDIPQDAAPGVYTGSIRVTAQNMQEVSIPIQVEVRPEILPAPKAWKVHLDLWQHPQAVARWHDVEPWSELHFALMKPAMQRLADAGQKVITCTLLDEAWNAQTYDWFPSQIRWIRGTDGTMRHDFTIFDKWVTFMMEEVGIRDYIACYTMIPWHHKIRYYDEATGKYAEIVAKPGTPAYRQMWSGFLRSFREHLRNKGWLEKTAIGIDERPDGMVRAAMELVRENAPELRVFSAVDKPSALSEEVYHISPVLTHAGSTLGELLNRRKAAGYKTTFYVCLHPKKPNTFTYSPPAEAEWLGFFAAANNLDGFLRWAYNSWNRNPFETTDFVHWPSGDCFLVYPGNLSSIRFERLRDGLEEFEKIRILRERAGEGPQARQAVENMNHRLAELFTVERSVGDTHTADVQAARQLVEETANAMR